jgi:hypothetical protein
MQKQTSTRMRRRSWAVTASWHDMTETGWLPFPQNKAMSVSRQLTGLLRPIGANDGAGQGEPMNRQKMFIQATCVAAVLLSVGAMRTQAASLPPSLATLDPDNDGTVSLVEAKAAAVKKFDAIDTDHEGTLSPEEAKEAIIQSAFSKADPDKDGTIDKAEWAALVEQHFKAADPDHDGTLDAKELESPEGKQLLKLLQ